MEIRVSNQQGRVPVTVFHIVGDVDTNTYQQLQAQAEQAHAAGASNIVLDLSQAGYVSSAGIRAINHIYTLLRTNAPAESDEAVRQGIKAGTFTSPHLKLARLNKRVSEALKTAGVDMFLEFYADLDAAIASFS
jgi:anti-anti-sigma factor